MTVAIKESLTLMHEVLKDLEANAAQAEQNAKNLAAKAANNSGKKSSPDLFSVPAGPAQTNDVDAKALASRLDSAIAKVENLLKEEA